MARPVVSRRAQKDLRRIWRWVANDAGVRRVDQLVDRILAVCDVFAAQPQAYRDEVLPPAQRRRVSVEAGITMGWREHLGDRGVAVGIDRYGASAPGELVLERLGITADAVAAAARRAIAATS